MNFRHLLLVIILLLPAVSFAQDDERSVEQEQYEQWAKGIWDSLDRQTGEIKLPNAVARLNVPDSFYYLNPSDAEKVLVDVWGNPPQQNTLGMLFPESMTPFDQESWAVTIEYEEDGYVSDEDADDIDYSELLEQMQSETDEASLERPVKAMKLLS